MSALPRTQPAAPDLIEPIVGFRQWRLVGQVLTSMFSPTRWTAPDLRARCESGRHGRDDAPAHGCTCGIYAYYDPCPRTASAATPDLVGGAVVVWGRVEVHATGLRAEHAQIVGLELPMSRGHKRQCILAAAEWLEVPAVPHRELKRVALDRGRPLQRSLRPPRTRGAATNLWRRPARERS